MLDGLEVSEVKLSELERTKRIDAEYYRPAFLSLLKIQAENTKKTKSLLDACEKIDVGFVGSMVHAYSDETGVPLLQTQNIKPFFIDTSDLKYVYSWFHDELKKSQIFTGDVLIARSGSIGNAVVVSKNDPQPLNSSDIIIIRPKKNLNEYYLCAYINSKFGQIQIERLSSGGVQGHINLGALETVIVPITSSEFQSAIENIVKLARSKLEQSKRLYAEAEEILLNELGLKNWSPPKESAAVKSFSESFGKSGRLDAEHYHPKYDAALKAILSLKPLEMLPLGEMVTEITNGHTPYWHDLSTGEIPFITAEFVSDFRINFESDKFVTQKHHQGELEKTALKENDLLITIKGRTGNAAVVNHLPGEMNINQDVGLIRLNEKYHPYYVAAFLNSILGKELTEQASTGQINPFLGLGNLKFVPIPIFETRLMNKLGEKIKSQLEKAYNASQESKRLLEMSKRAVEVSIERGESAGMRVLE